MSRLCTINRPKWPNTTEWMARTKTRCKDWSHYILAQTVYSLEKNFWPDASWGGKDATWGHHEWRSVLFECIRCNYLTTFEFFIQTHFIRLYVDTRAQLDLNTLLDPPSELSELYEQLFHSAYMADRVAFIRVLYQTDPAIVSRMDLECLYTEGFRERCGQASRWLEPILQSTLGCDTTVLKWMYLKKIIINKSQPSVQWFRTTWPDFPISLWDHAIVNMYFIHHLEGQHTNVKATCPIWKTLIQWYNYQCQDLMLIHHDGISTLTSRSNYSKIQEKITKQSDYIVDLGIPFEYCPADSIDLCAVCVEPHSALVRLPCGHAFCLRDITEYYVINVNQTESCFLCRQPWNLNECTYLILVQTNDQTCLLNNTQTKN